MLQYCKRWAPSSGQGRNCNTAPMCEWFIRDFQRELVAVATADRNSAASWVWPYTDVFNCVRPAFLIPKRERERWHRKYVFHSVQTTVTLMNFKCLCNMCCLFSVGFINLMVSLEVGRCLEKVKSTWLKPEIWFTEKNHQLKPSKLHPSLGVILSGLYLLVLDPQKDFSTGFLF